MNVNTICSRRKFCYFPLLMLAFLILGMASCSDDEEEGVNYSYLEDGMNKLVVSSTGVVEDTIPLKYVVRGKTSWRVEKETDVDWLKILTESGEEVQKLDGLGTDTLRFIINQNEEVVERSVNLLFTEGGTQFAVLKVTQRGSEPFLKLIGMEEYDANPNGGIEQKIAIQTNCELDFEVDYGEETGDWLTVQSADKEGIYVDVKKLDFLGSRSCSLIAFKKNDKDKMSLAIPVVQWNARKVFEDDFSWMNRYKFEGNVEKEADPENFEYYNYPELGYGAWTDDEKHGHGWGVLNEAEGFVYGGLGYIKLGATNQVGMYASPMLSELKEGTHDVEVSFKAIGYTSNKGVHDNSIFHVTVTNGGTVESPETTMLNYNNSGTTYLGAKFELKVFPNTPEERNSGNGYDPWTKDDCVYSFKVKDATQYTKIIFVGGPTMVTVTSGVKTRMMIDDVQIWSYRVTDSE